MTHTLHRHMIFLVNSVGSLDARALIGNREKMPGPSFFLLQGPPASRPPPRAEAWCLRVESYYWKVDLSNYKVSLDQLSTELTVVVRIYNCD